MPKDSIGSIARNHFGTLLKTWSRSPLFWFALLSFVAHWRILILPFQLGYGDLSTFPETIGQAITDFVFAWRELGAGIYRSPGHTQSLLQAFFLLFFRTPLVAQKAYIFLLTIVSSLSFFYFAKKILKISYFPGLILASTFYSYSPIFTGEFLGGTLYSTLLGFALFPLVVTQLTNLLEKVTIKRILLLSLSLSFILSINPHAVVIFSLALLPLFFFNWLDFKLILNKLPAMLLVIILVFLINPISPISNFNIINLHTNTGETTSFANNFQTFLADIHYTYHESILSANMRLSGFINPLNFQHSKPIQFFSYLLIAAVLTSSFTSYHRSKLKPISFLFGYLVFVGIIFLIKWRALDQVFFNFPVLFMFRNPAKLTSISTFFFSSLLVLVFHKKNLEIFSKYKKTWAVFFIIGCISFNPTFLFGNRGLNETRQNYLLDNTYYEILKFSQKNKDKQNQTRNIYFAPSHELVSIKLVWLDRNKIESQAGLDKFGNNYLIGDLANNLYRAIGERDATAAATLMNISSTQNLIIFSNGINRETLARELPFLKVVRNTTDYTIYSNENYYPLLYLANCDELLCHPIPNSPKVTFQKISPVRYDIDIRGVKNMNYNLVFSAAYDPNWKLVTTPKNTFEKLFFKISPLEGVSENKTTNLYANKWEINTQKICEHNEVCTKYDNEYDIKFSLVFVPQKYLNISMISSFITIGGILSVLFLILTHEKKK